MQAFRKLGLSRAVQLASAWKKPLVASQFMKFRTMTFKDDEMNGPGDDDYFRSAEDIRQRKTMRANYLRIQSLPEHAYEKFALQQMLVPKKQSEMPWRERWDFYDWRLALPASCFMILPIFASEIIPINSYYFIITMWLWNSYLCYIFVAPRITPDLNEGVYELIKEVQGADDRIIQTMEGYIADNEKLIGWEDEVKSALDISDELTIAQVDVFNAMEGHAFRDTVALKLDALVSLEIAANQNIRQRMLAAVKGDVKTLFLTNKTARENAMNQAIAILQAGQDAKMGKDVVGDAYNQAVKDYQENYSKQAAGTDDIILALEKDMAAVIVPPTFEVTGGNVFETNHIRL